MSLWPVIRDLFIKRAAEELIEVVSEEVQEALSNRKQEQLEQSDKKDLLDKKELKSIKIKK